jgi:hypothetical protein
MTVSHFGSKFEQWLMGTPNTTLRLKAAHAPQNSTLQPIERLQISYLPAFPLSHFKMTVPALGSKFEWWLIVTLNTTLRLKPAYAIQNSMLQPTELLQISYVPSSNFPSVRFPTFPL